jgi:hypothetical protein
MLKHKFGFVDRLWSKVCGLSLGLALGSGATILGQSCAGSGGCAACGGACASRLPLAVLPLLIPGMAVLAHKVWAASKSRENRPPN